MVMNFAEYDGPDQRSGVRPAQSRGPLWRELVTASAGDIAAKGTPIFSGAEVEALIISSQLFGEWVGREQIHFFAQRAERERPRACVELCLVKDQKAARGNKAAVRHAELAGLIKIVGDKPAADVGIVRGKIEQLNRIVRRRRIAMREHFVDDDPRYGRRCRVVGAR